VAAPPRRAADPPEGACPPGSLTKVHLATAERYVAHVRTLIPERRPFPRSSFTAPAVAGWLAGRRAQVAKWRPPQTGSRRREDPPARPLSGSSKWKYLAAIQSFAKYLREIGVVTSNPAAELTAPRAAPPAATSSSERGAAIGGDEARRHKTESIYRCYAIVSQCDLAGGRG
jgi:hypothetical protein